MHLIRPRSAAYPRQIIDRDDLVEGTYFPDATNTGSRGPYAQVITANTTYSSVVPTTIENVWFDGARVSFTGSNVTLKNCLITGPNANTALVTATNINAGALGPNRLIDCTLIPKFPRHETNAFNGHDVEFIRCDISRCTDLAQIQNSALWNSMTTKVPGYSIHTHFVQCYLHDMARWTAAAAGVVHPSDTVSHNDIFQIFGGTDLQVRGCTVDARWALQYAHLYLKRISDNYVYTEQEAQALPDTGPFVSVALNSLPNGGPFVPPFESNGTGLRSRGEYNSPDLAGLMMNSQFGYTADIVFSDNLCMGGQFFVNGGGNPNPGGGINLGTFVRNAFTRDQGSQGTGAGNGHTLNFGGTWAGNVTAPTTGLDRNYYIDNGDPITVRN